MITKKDLITDKQLEQDIKELPKNFNPGRSKAIAGVFRLNEAESRKRAQQKAHGKARRKHLKAYGSGCTNGMARANRRLGYSISETKN